MKLKIISEQKLNEKIKKKTYPLNMTIAVKDNITKYNKI